MPRLLLALAAVIAAIVLLGDAPGLPSGGTAASGAGGSGVTRLGNAGRAVGAGAVSSAARIGN